MFNFIHKNKRHSKPNNPRFNLAHPVVKNATSLLSMDRIDENGAPWDDAAKAFWATVTTNGTTPYKKKPLNGAMNLVRQDIDQSGICYRSPAFGVDVDTTPFFIVMVYTILAAPSSSGVGFTLVGNAPRDGSGSFNRTAESSATMQSWIGGWRFTSTPVNVGEKHLMIVRYDGVDDWDFYDSADAVWRKLTQGASNGQTDDSFWLGTAWNAELPTAFEYFVSGIGSVPALEDLKSLVKNPYQIFEPQEQLLYYDLLAIEGGVVYERVLSDSAGVADQQQSYEEKLRLLLSNLTANDSLIRTLQLAGAAIERTLASNIDVNDLVNRDTLLLRLLTSEVSLTDAIQSIKGTIIDRVLSSSVNLFDIIQTEKEITRLVSDALVLTDAVLQDKTLLRLLSDNLELVDIIARTITLTPQTYSRILSDNTAIQDLILRETTGQLVQLILSAIENQYDIVTGIEIKHITVDTKDL